MDVFAVRPDSIRSVRINGVVAGPATHAVRTATADVDAVVATAPLHAVAMLRTVNSVSALRPVDPAGLRMVLLLALWLALLLPARAAAGARTGAMDMLTVAAHLVGVI